MFDFDPEKRYAKETESRVVIRFQDCDPLRHLNNAKYFDYFFNAREDQVPKLYGLEIIDLIRVYKAAWVVYNHNISYVKPAMVGDWVRIYSRILWYNANTILVEYYLTDDSKTQLKTLLWSTMRYVTLEDGRSSDHAGAVVDFLEATSLHLDPSSLDIRERVKQLKRELEQGG